MSDKRYQKFNPNIDLSSFDHVIVGSGMGGLTVATWLAKAGKKVVVLERHYKPGGFTHSFKRRKGFQWDVGVHYVGNVAENGSLKALFDFLTNHKLKWASMGEVYDIVHIEDDCYKIRAGKENFRTQLKEYFPEESQAIDNYIKLVFRSNKIGGAFFIEKSFEPLLSWAFGWIIKRWYAKYSKQTTHKVLSKLTTNKRLITLLCAQCGNYGLTPKQSSFAAHAMVIGHFMEGGYYPVGGADKIPEKTIETLTNLGSEVFVNADVNEIVVEKNRVQGLKIDDVFYPCKKVISNVGINNTFNHLLSNSSKIQCKINLKNVKPSSAHMCLYVGLDQSDEKLNLPKNNIWSFANDDQEAIFKAQSVSEAAQQFSYISFPSAKDPDWQTINAGTATIQAITFGNYEWFSAFENQPWRNREKAYNDIKSSFEQIMLERLYDLFPQIKGHVIVTEVSSPLSTRHFSNYKNGEIYGLAHSPERFSLPFLRPQTKIKGLRLVGQDITLVGVAGAMLSGMLCAITILKFGVWRLFKGIKKVTE